MNAKEEEKALVTEILSYMWSYGKALENKDSGAINTYKKKVIGLIENVDLAQLNSVSELLEQFNTELEADKNVPDKELRLRGLQSIRDILDAEINDKGLEQAAQAARERTSLENVAKSLAAGFSDLVNELDDLADFTKSRQKAPSLTTETEKVVKKVEKKLEVFEVKVENLVAEVSDIQTVPGKKASTAKVELKEYRLPLKSRASVKEKRSKPGPSQIKKDQQGFSRNPAFSDNPFMGEVPQEELSRSIESVDNLQKSVENVRLSLEKSSTEDEGASAKKIKYPALEKLSARLTVIGIYLKSVKEHLSPLKPRGIVNIELKDRILGKLKTAMDDAKENPLKLEIFQNSHKKLSKPRPEKAKMSSEKPGFFAKKGKTENAKKKGKTQSSSVEIVDEGFEFEPETKKSRRGKAGKKGGGGGRFSSTL